MIARINTEAERNVITAILQAHVNKSAAVYFSAKTRLGSNFLFLLESHVNKRTCCEHGKQTALREHNNNGLYIPSPSLVQTPAHPTLHFIHQSLPRIVVIIGNASRSFGCNTDVYVLLLAVLISVTTIGGRCRKYK